MRAIFPIAALGLLVACSPQVPDSGAGFDTTFEEAKAQDAAIAGARTGAAVPAPKIVSAETLGEPAVVASPTPSAPATPVVTRTAAVQTDAASDIALETAAALEAAALNSGEAPLQASPTNPPPVPLSNPGISDENDFTAVSARESIESDAERLARNKASYQAVAPSELPQRPASEGPNIVSYAISTSNAPGQRVYSRSGFNGAARAERNCAKYPSPDQAQIDFLAHGGPQRDRKGLDPDGDGFACSWDPRPFRVAVGN